MQGKNTLIVALILFAAVSAYLGYQQIQKNSVLQTLSTDAIAECKENLIFLHTCESFMRDSVSETDAMIQAQAETKKQLKSRAINSLIQAGISGKKKDIVNRISDEIDRYNGVLAYVFYAATGASVSYPENAPGTGEMIKQFMELEQVLEGK